MAERTRNPKWSRDELILALDFYYQVKDHFPNGSSDLRVKDLSRRLNLLTKPAGVGDVGKFRNPNGAMMKLMNFRRLDPEFAAQGKSGLKNGGKLEEDIWNEFRGQPGLLVEAVSKISPQGGTSILSSPAKFCLYSESEGRYLDANFSMEFMGDKTRIFIHANGGGTGNSPKKNPEYSVALTLLLRRLQTSCAVVHSVRLASTTVKDKNESERQLSIDGFQLPITFSGREDLKMLQASIQRAGASAFRKPNASGSGNREKKIEFEVSGPGQQEEFISYIKHGGQGETPSNTWIFQANPDTFDINSYLESRFTESAPIRWVVRQNSTSVQAGDNVFIWRSAGKKRGESGVIASGTILTEPEIMADDSGGLWSAGKSSAELRVVIELHEMRLSPEEGMLRAQDFSTDPSFQQLRILRLRSETNYLLTADHGSQLMILWNSEADQLKKQGFNVGFSEGEKKERMHMRRERNRKLVHLAKSQFIAKHGRLFCEACGFNAHSSYGIDPDKLIEAHHKVAVSELEAGSYTRVEDLLMLCPNCHRAVHHRRPWLSMDELLALIRAGGLGANSGF
jgi:predicted HNH restriction endonuclease